ncbi:MAG: hypothetical protein Q9P01_01830 [Anaerolineae bacterium]|nr:hypothetical protein [Anaerolineae bacterium]MDQ7033600.1 hypothetical protein [Anaerolineae bacterium]
MPPIIYNTVGTIGVFVILLTYFLLQTGRIQSEQVLYSLLNLVGASMILFSLFFEFNLPSFFVEVFWVAISLMGLWRKRDKLTLST